MYLFFDTETTGLPKNWKTPVTDLNNWPRLVQLAYLYFDNKGNIIDSGDFIIKPDGFNIPSDASLIHGITNEKAIREGQPITSVLQYFNSLIEKARYLVAHNISFDEKIVGSEFLRNGIQNNLTSKHKICTMKSTTNFCAIDGPYGYKWPKLSELHYKLFGTGFEETHNAAADIEATAKCFWELVDKGIICIDTIRDNKFSGNRSKSESEETIDSKNQMDRYCKENGINEIPIAAKVKAIMYLGFKFKQLDIDANTEDEFIFLRDYWARNESKLLKTNENQYQHEFSTLIKKKIINEYQSLRIFNKKDKTIEDKILQLEALSLLISDDSQIFRDLVIHIYYYYLSLYKDFLPNELKPTNNI